jgi:hypothetical protein
VQPGANTQADSPTAPDPQKSLNGIVSGSEDVEVPPAKAPQSSPKTVTIGDDDIDRALDKAYSIIAHNQLDKGFRGIETGTFFPSPSQFKQAVITSLRDYGDYYGHMQDLDTDVAFNRDTFYKYEGNKYPLLTGKTFSGPDLNYLGVGAGFAAGGVSPIRGEIGRILVEKPPVWRKAVRGGIGRRRSWVAGLLEKPGLSGKPFLEANSCSPRSLDPSG